MKVSRRRGARGPVVTLALGLGLVVGLTACATAKDLNGVEVAKAPAARRLSTQGVAHRAAASVATVTTNVGRGMAFVVDPAGYLITNRHVLEDADHVESVVFPAYDPPLEFRGVEVVYIDPVEDLALLRVRPGGDQRLRALPMAVRDDVPVTDYVAADDAVMLLSGEPTSDAPPDATAEGLFAHVGAVTALDVKNPAVGPGPFLGLTANVRRGQSGGPVLDRFGRVVGIVTWTWRDRPGGYAVPAGAVSRMLEQRPVFNGEGDHQRRVNARAEAFLASLGDKDYDRARLITAPSHARKVRSETLEVLTERLSAGLLEGYVEALDTLLSKSMSSGGDPLAELGGLVAHLGSPESLEALDVSGTLSQPQVITFFYEFGQAYLAARVFAQLDRDAALGVALERIQSLDAARSFALADVLDTLGQPGVAIEQVTMTPGAYGPRATVTVVLPPEALELGRSAGPQTSSLGDGRRLVLQMAHEWGDWYVADVQSVGATVASSQVRPSPLTLEPTAKR